MNNPSRRLAALGLAAILIVGVGFAIFQSVSQHLGPTAVTLRGLIGSEKQPFFSDPQVVAALHRGGFDVIVATAGSRQIATADLSNEDFAFPAGGPSAAEIALNHSGTTSIVPFYTPMAIATFQPIVDLLTQAGVVTQQPGYLGFDMTKYMALVASDKRWIDLPGNTTYPVNKSILITSTDVRKSNSAAMYLAIASYVVNGDNIVQNNGDIDSIVQQTAPLFLKQGFVESSTEEPFDDYLVQGMGKSPLVMIYEAQYVAAAASTTGGITSQMRLMYPEPTIFSKHTFVGLTPDGTRLGNFIATDPEMRTLATQYGFRTSDTAAFSTFVTNHGLTIPDSLNDVIDPPSYEALEAMITQFEGLYAGSLPTLSPSETP